jgi:hypothetical protein
MGHVLGGELARGESDDLDVRATEQVKRESGVLTIPGHREEGVSA